MAWCSVKAQGQLYLANSTEKKVPCEANNGSASQGIPLFYENRFVITMFTRAQHSYPEPGDSSPYVHTQFL
jgi:hypothetical protein